MKYKSPLIIYSLSVLLSTTSISCSNTQKITSSDTTKKTELEDLLNKKITLDVQSELLAQEGVEWEQVDVEVDKSIVKLNGSVDNLLAKQRALEITKSVKGVRGVLDLLTVKSPFVSDETLHTRVSKALTLNMSTDSYKITTEIKHGTVYLLGIVDSHIEKESANKVVMGIPGIKKVKNYLTYKEIKKRADTEIKYDIEEALKWDIKTDNELIRVNVEKGIVHIIGTVGSQIEKERVKNMSSISGVASVNVSKLDIEKWAEEKSIRQGFVNKSDQEIEKAINDVIAYDPRITNSSLQVNVLLGKVTVRGNVANYEHVKIIEQNIKNTLGVWKVFNLVSTDNQNLTSDNSLKDDIDKLLASDTSIKEENIIVYVEGASVILSGNVPTMYEKLKIEYLVGQLNQIESIFNNIKIIK